MKKLTKKWQIFLYGIAGLGVNMLGLIVGSYLCDALMVEGFDKNVENWTYLNKTLVVAAVWSVMVLVAKVIDGVIDIPFAAFTDNLKTKWGKRRPAIIMGFVPMVVAYVLFLTPISTAENSLANTIWFGIMLCLFYSFYTLTMVTYYATFSEIVDNDSDRLFLSNVKTVFDVVYFVLGYAVIPILVGSVNIRIIGFLFLPLSLTMLIPMFMIKEHSTLPKDVEKRKAEHAEKEEQKSDEEETVGLWESLKYSFKNKSFLIWMGVFAALQFSLQLFLTGQNVFYSGTMKLEGWKITVIMACAFAPTPLTLILYNKIVKKYGIKVGYLFSLITFVLSLAIMSICTPTILPNETLRLVIACVGALFASFGIGCFFSINYTIPATIAAIEKQKTGISHPAMYFAVQGLASGIATAISTGLIWVNLKNIGEGAYVWLMPIIAIVGCALSFGLTFLLPKELNEIGKTK